MKKLWGGAFGAATDELVEAFGQSLADDLTFWREDVLGSIAHARMLGATGILTEEEARRLIDGLEQVLSEGPERLPTDVEDIHTAVEVRLGEIVGEVAGKLHTARSRNDQVATDARLRLRFVGKELLGKIKSTQGVLLEEAFKHRRTLMPGWTHQQPAQPITLGYHLMAHFWALQRDGWRWQNALAGANWCPLGSAALAGTGFPIDRRQTSAELGFAGPIPNALDATSDRSFVLDSMHASASLMLSLSRIAQELVLWSGAEFGFVRLSDSVTTGSSIMPQKRNPDMAELIRGRTAKAIASWVQIATMMKALPLGYNRDTQDDKPPLFAAIRLASDSLELTATMIAGAEWNAVRMREAAGAGYSVATDLADLLASRGIPFRVAHEITGEAVRMAAAAKSPTLRAEWVEAACRAKGVPAPDEAELKRLDPASCVMRRESEGGPGPKAMAKQFSLARKVHRKPGFPSPY